MWLKVLLSRGMGYGAEALQALQEISFRFACRGETGLSFGLEFPCD